MTPGPPANNRPENVEGQARELCRTMAGIHRKGWCEGTGGNFSCVLSRDPLHLLMAPSGVDKGAVRPTQLIVVDEGGQVVQGEGRVSAEMALHREIVMGTGAGAVLHTHSQAATLLSQQAIHRTSPPSPTPGPAGSQTVGADATDQSAHRAATPGSTATIPASHISIEGLEMLKGLEGIHTHACRIQIPVLANDQDLDRLSAAARPHLEAAPHGILIAGHGLYAWGCDLTRAKRHLEILEFLLEQHWRQILLDALTQNTP